MTQDGNIRSVEFRGRARGTSRFRGASHRLASPRSRVTESTSTVPAAAGSAFHDDLLATKVTVPRVRRGFVARPGLAERIDDATSYDLCLVCSPPGFGKTTQLAAWAAASDRAVAWLALDEDDNDPVRFWRYVIAALRQVRPGLGRQTSTLLTHPGNVPINAVVTALINELTMRGDDL